MDSPYKKLFQQPCNIDMGPLNWKIDWIDIQQPLIILDIPADFDYFAKKKT